MLRNFEFPLAISIGFEADPVSGGDPTPAPAAPEPSVLGGDPDPVDPPTDPVDPPTDPVDPPTDPVDPPEPTAEEKAETERRAALTDEERKAEDDAKAIAEAGAPEAYDFAEVLGEDGPQLDEKMLGEFTGILKEHNLTQAQANQYMGFAKQLQESWLGQITQAHIDARAAWRAEAQADTEIGGDKFSESAALAKKAVDAFGTPAFKKFLDETGLGDHPEMIRFAHNVGVVNREHEFVKDGRPAPTKPFYDNPSSQTRK